MRRERSISRSVYEKKESAKNGERKKKESYRDASERKRDANANADAGEGKRAAT